MHMIVHVPIVTVMYKRNVAINYIKTKFRKVTKNSNLACEHDDGMRLILKVFSVEYFVSKCQQKQS